MGGLVVGFDGGGWVPGGWVWVILGLCWVHERVPERRGKEIIKNVKRLNILLNKCVEWIN